MLVKSITEEQAIYSLKANTELLALRRFTVLLMIICHTYKCFSIEIGYTLMM